jgi:1-pyrroline-4-hydroxy-2-carboxylate deaminase
VTVDWNGSLHAITIPFRSDLLVDHGFLAEHAGWMLDAGCVGTVAFGSLGEAATLGSVCWP